MNEQDNAVREFLAESYENLDQLERDLVTIEDHPRDRETLGRIFRTIHSIKGACGFLAYPRLEAVAHAGEGLLSLLRDGELEWRPEITSGLLALADAMRRIMGTIEATANEGTGEYSGLIDRLVALQSRDAGADQPPDSAGSVPTPAEITELQPSERKGEAPSSVAGAGELPSRGPIVATHEDTGGERDRTSGVPSNGISSGNIRVDVGLLDKLMNLVGELVLARNQILQHANAREDTGLLGTSQRLNLITTELQEGVMKTRMQPIGSIWNKFPRVVRDLALGCGKHIRVELEGSETELDRTIIEAIKDPLTHLVRNAVDHGIEAPVDRVRLGKSASGCLRLRAFHESGQVNIEIVDDGAGINVERVTRHAMEHGLLSREQAARMGDHDLMQLIFLPGFSTAERITNLSGRGVGMDVAKTNIEKIGGTIEVHSIPGQGTTLKIKIPLTLAIIPALIVTVDGDRYAIPQVNLLELVRLEREQAAQGIEVIHGAPIFRLRGSLLPLVNLERMLNPSISSISPTAGRVAAGDEGVNFASLRDAHFRWKTRVAAVLEGREQLEPDQLVAAGECDLGRWLRALEARRFTEQPEFAALTEAYNVMHAAAKDVLSLHHEHRRTEAQAAMDRVEKHSRTVISLLGGVERAFESSDAVNIVVLQSDGRRFGLVVQGISDTEEIVVKPLGKQLKGIALFAGATIMGDGQVCLILDVAGIAHRAGVVSGMAERLATEEAKEQKEQKDERTAYLLLRNGAEGRLAIPLSLVARLEEIPCSAIELSQSGEVVQYRNQIIPLVRLSQALSHGYQEEPMDRETMQVVVYTQKGQSVGLVVDKIVDIVEDTIQLRQNRSGRGLIGSAVIQQRVTDVVDVPGLIQRVAPELVLSPSYAGE